MKVSELYNHVAQLGFEANLENDEMFFNAANRALIQVGAIRPEIRTCTINHRPMKNMIAGRENDFNPVQYNGDNALEFTASDVVAYYFEADGNGTAVIEKYNSATQTWDTSNTLKTITLNGGRAFKTYYGFIENNDEESDDEFVHGLVRIRFNGDFLYSVKSVAMYSGRYSTNEDDIPAFEPYTRYDVGSMVDDFLSLETPPIKEADRSVENQKYDVENGRVILLPNDVSGVYTVQYRHRPTQISYVRNVKSDNSEIDLDEELCSILPMLIASYVWADDEPEKANYYLNLYRERALDIERREKNFAPARIRSVNGW